MVDSGVSYLASRPSASKVSSFARVSDAKLKRMMMARHFSRTSMTFQEDQDRQARAATSTRAANSLGRREETALSKRLPTLSDSSSLHRSFTNLCEEADENDARRLADTADTGSSMLPTDVLDQPEHAVPRIMLQRMVS